MAWLFSGWIGLGDRLNILFLMLVVWKQKGLGLTVLLNLLKSINTETSSGKFMFHVFGALSEFERNLIKERTRAGFEAARARGRQGGRPEKLSDEQKELVKTLYSNKKNSIQSICKMVGAGKTALYKYINK